MTTFLRSRVTYIAISLAALCLVLRADPPASTSAPVFTTGNQTITGTKNFTGTLQVGGITLALPSGPIVGTTDTQTLSNKTFVAPALGAATATSLNGLTLTTSTGTITLTNGKTLAVTNSLTLSGTDSSTLNIGAGGTLAASAFTDTTNAANISSGTLSSARLPSGAKFIARASADQTFASGVATVMTLNTSLANIGSYFNTSNSRWTPPAGFYYIGVAMRCDPAGTYLVYVGKNGSTFWSFTYEVAANEVSGGIIVQASGTDYFEIWVTNNAASSRQIYTSDSQGYAYGFSLP